MSGRKRGLERRGQTRHGPGITISRTAETIMYGKATLPPPAESWWMNQSQEAFYRAVATRHAQRLRGVNL